MVEDAKKDEPKNDQPKEIVAKLPKQMDACRRAEELELEAQRIHSYMPGAYCKLMADAAVKWDEGDEPERAEIARKVAGPEGIAKSKEKADEEPAVPVTEEAKRELGDETPRHNPEHEGDAEGADRR
jgi:hypothetical protein